MSAAGGGLRAREGHLEVADTLHGFHVGRDTLPP